MSEPTVQILLSLTQHITAVDIKAKQPAAACRMCPKRTLHRRLSMLYSNT